MLAIYRAEIPQQGLANDPHVLADMAAVSFAALQCWIDVLEEDRVVDGEFLRPVLDVIRRRAVQGVGIDVIMRACRLAIKAVWREILELPVRQELVAPLSTRMLEFTDQLTTAAEQAYADETLRAMNEPELSSSALFEAILSGTPQKHLLGATWLSSPHCVVIVETADSVSADLAAALVREARAAYWTTRANSVVAAACPIDGPKGRDVLIRRLARFTNARRPLRVAVGGMGEGPAGTRHSYHEALEAMRIGARIGADEGRVYDSQELTPLAMLIGDPDRAKRFVKACLYPLGKLAERSWVLPTLAAYLKCQGRLKEVAVELAVHPSTVKYRLNELRSFLDTHAADGDQAAALLLAVRISECFAQVPESSD